MDNAIAEALKAFSAQRDETMLRHSSAEAIERLGFFVHELRNSLQTATVAPRRPGRAPGSTLAV